MERCGLDGDGEGCDVAAVVKLTMMLGGVAAATTADAGSVGSTGDAGCCCLAAAAEGDDVVATRAGVGGGVGCAPALSFSAAASLSSLEDPRPRNCRASRDLVPPKVHTRNNVPAAYFFSLFFFANSSSSSSSSSLCPPPPRS